MQFIFTDFEIRFAWVLIGFDEFLLIDWPCFATPVILIAWLCFAKPFLDDGFALLRLLSVGTRKAQPG